MNAVARENPIWGAVKPFLLMLLALLLGWLLMDAAFGVEPKLPPEPAPVYIVSPWNGTFYASEYEGAKPFVAVGGKVEVHTVVCIVEAMKQFRIPAGVEGTIVEVLAKDNQMVSPGQPLFKVQPIRPPGKPWEN